MEGESDALTEPFVIGPGLTSEVIRSGRPLLIHDLGESTARGAITVGNLDTESWLGVPMVAGERVRGAIILESLRRNAFDESDVRLLSTLAASVGVAVENARLVDETKRLLVDTEERAAELALINEIGTALARQLDFDAIIELVGERLRAIFKANADDLFVALHDEASDVVTFPYEIDRGRRVQSESILLGEGLTSIVIRTGRPLRLGQMRDQMALGGILTPETSESESWLGVPIPSGKRVIGAVVLGNHAPEAFDAADERLVSTVAAGMGVALENARLFGETKRLLAETDQRAAELALVNEIGQALAKQLDFDAIIELVGERIRTLFASRSLSICTYDDTTNLITWVYEIEEGQRLHSPAFVLGPGVTTRVIETRRPFLAMTRAELLAAGSVDLGGAVTESWLGVPVIAGERVIGVIVLESTQRAAFSESDARLLSTLASSMGVALENARLFGETKRLLAETEQRAAELALINEIGQALARHLDFDAIVELVGKRLRSIFRSQARDLGVGIYDRGAGTITFPYFIDTGRRVRMVPMPLGTGLTSIVVEHGRPLRLGTTAEQAAATTLSLAPGLSQTESWLGVPIPSGAEVIGAIIMGHPRKNAFSESDERLVSTVAASMGVALQNARLFGETKRLLAETDQRAAELALVNEIGQALAKQLDFDAIVELVGERIRSLFEATTITLAIYDPATQMIAFPYTVDEGRRDYGRPSRPLGEGLNSTIIEERRPLLFGRGSESDAAGAIITGTSTESWLGVPILAGDAVVGVVSLKSMRVDAYTESDQRVLTTIVSSMGVALENARLFAETKRLLAETDQRAAELAIINGVQEGLASKLEMGAMYELVGDKIQAIFDAQVVDIAMLDREAGLIRFEYTIERGVRFPNENIPVIGARRHVLETGQPLLINRDATAAVQALGQPGALSGEPARAALFVPLPVGGRPGGVISLQNLDHEDAFTDSDVQLLSTIAASFSVALENVRLVDETRQRASELAIINSVQQGLAEQLEMQAMVELVGEKIRELFDAQVVDVGLYDPADLRLHFPYTIERGVRFPDEPIALVGFRRHVFETGQPLLIDHDADAAGERYGNPARHQRRAVALAGVRPPARGGQGRRRRVAAEPRPRVRLRRRGRAAALDDRGEPQRVAGERPPVRRDEAPAPRDRPASGGAGHHQRGPAGPGRPARHAGDVRPRRRQGARDLRRPGRRHRRLRPGRRDRGLPLRQRAGRPPRSSTRDRRRASAGVILAKGQPLLINRDLAARRARSWARRRSRARRPGPSSSCR